MCWHIYCYIMLYIYIYLFMLFNITVMLIAIEQPINSTKITILIYMLSMLLFVNQVLTLYSILFAICSFTQTSCIHIYIYIITHILVLPLLLLLLLLWLTTCLPYLPYILRICCSMWTMLRFVSCCDGQLSGCHSTWWSPQPSGLLRWWPGHCCTHMKQSNARS